MTEETTVASGTQDEFETPDLPPSPTFAQRAAVGPVTIAHLVAKADAVSQSYKGLLDVLVPAENSLINERDKIRRHLEEYSRTKSPQQRKRDIADEQDYARRKIVAGTDEKRWAHLKAMQKQLGELEATAELFATPAHIVMRAGIGTEERQRYREDVEASGPVELRGLAALAVHSKNQVLAAVILRRLDGMSKAEREQVGISRQELAAAVAGEQHKRAMGAINRARDAMKAAMARNRAFQSGRPFNPATRIGIGVRRPHRDGDNLDQPGGKETD
jgi:hypothetical protein